ncbi:MAG: peptide chain release factor N(5)-glutamine methyltransferase [Bacteroidales bacterium]|nr:peptide chain release factor N(5)-glutamine methyltransferase [Bacteroidales bacterium]
MEPPAILTDIQNQFTSGLSAFYPMDEIRNIFFLVSEHLLNYSKIDILMKGNEPISAEVAENFNQVLVRLRNWEPVQYILGRTEFYGLPFNVDQRVLIPRPETEELVEWIVRQEGARKTSILDIGTGSGCIAVALSARLSEAGVWACDIQKEALEVAVENARNNGVEINFFSFDMLNEQSSLPCKFDVMVSNPPYVREQEKAFMRRNVLDYEPSAALYVPDDDPLKFYRSIALLARKYLNDGGSLYLEINEKFPQEVVKLLKNAGLYAVEVKRDLGGKSRMVRGIK